MQRELKLLLSGELPQGAMRKRNKAVHACRLKQQLAASIPYFFFAVREHKPTAAKVSAQGGYVTFWCEARAMWYL